MNKPANAPGARAADLMIPEQTRGPYPIMAGVAAYERHLKRHPNRALWPGPIR